MVKMDKNGCLFLAKGRKSVFIFDICTKIKYTINNNEIQMDERLGRAELM